MKFSSICFVALSFISFTGCGGGGSSSSTTGGAAKPEDVAKNAVEAMAAGDMNKLKALFPSDDALKPLVKCPKDNFIVEEVQKEKSKAERQKAKMDEAGVTKLEFVSAEVKDTKVFKKGEKEDGCEFLKDVELARVKAKMKFTIKDKTEEEKEGMEMIKIDGKWYLMGI